MSKVSILIPCYNAERFIAEAVQSALDQDYPEKEIIVIDDGSADQSPAILQKFGAAINLTCRENRGGNYTRNELLSLASGEWIQYLDADDYLDAGKLTEQMSWIKKNNQFDVVYGPVMIVYDDGKVKKFDKQEVTFPDDPWAAMVSWELPQTGSPLFRKAALEKVGGWNNNQKVCQEHELYLRLLKSGARFIGVAAFHHIIQYRHWSDSTVSKRNLFNTYVTRMKIMEMAYQFMRENRLLNDFRNQVYLEWCLLLARGFWKYDKAGATLFFEKYQDIYPLKKINSKFLSPMFIRMVDWFGLGSAERFAEWSRKITD